MERIIGVVLILLIILSLALMAGSYILSILQSTKAENNVRFGVYRFLGYRVEENVVDLLFSTSEQNEVVRVFVKESASDETNIVDCVPEGNNLCVVKLTPLGKTVKVIFPNGQIFLVSLPRITATGSSSYIKIVSVLLPDGFEANVSSKITVDLCLEGNGPASDILRVELNKELMGEESIMLDTSECNSLTMTVTPSSWGWAVLRIFTSRSSFEVNVFIGEYNIPYAALGGISSPPLYTEEAIQGAVSSPPLYTEESVSGGTATPSVYTEEYVGGGLWSCEDDNNCFSD